MTPTIMMGIDPGSYATGFAFLSLTGNKASVLDYEVIRPQKNKELIFRIGHIIDELEKLIALHKPTVFCMEKAFFAKNANSALVLGHIRGAVMSLGFRHNLAFLEKDPRSIKLSVTGNGAASKEQVANMMSRLLGIQNMDCAFDASDALAIAWAGLFGNNR
ncbi:MAG: crossover junction endodeoxyribonuclease RuvC [Fibromonadales bacterium]|nr:crossover junction endodeoxyribonuclease RuvC [Fibromonadales bacterium]